MSWVVHALAQADRFWSNVRRGGPDECWPWTAGTDKDGYGKFAVTLPRVGGKNPQKHVRAHRMALVLEKGEDVDDYALHRCDNPSCCNPAHLREGTAKDNAGDCHARGRGVKRERHGRSKLAEADVAAIRAARGAETCRSLGAKYGVSPSTISHIWVNRNWRDESLDATKVERIKRR